MDMTSADGKAKAKVKAQNALVVYYLTLLSENEDQLGYIEDTRSNK